MEERQLIQQKDDIRNAVENASMVSDDIMQLVTFSLGEEEFGVDILNIREINRMHFLTRVPNSPPYVKGVMNLRGKVVPVIDLRKRLNLESKEQTKETRIIVLEIGSKVTGIIVDKVNEVIRLSQSVTEPPPHTTVAVDSGYISAIAQLEDRLLILLDTGKLISE